MQNNKLKLAISPTEDMWNKQDFRDLVEEIAEDTENTELYIVTTNIDSEFIDYINETTELDGNTHIFQEADIITLTAKLIELNIEIFLGDDYSQINYININNPISLIQTNITGTQAILINSLVNTYTLEPVYINKLTFWTNQIKKYK